MNNILMNLVWCCRKVFFEEESGKLREKAAKEEKRMRRAKEDFIVLLKETRRLKHDTTWSDAKAILEKEPEYKAVSIIIAVCLVWDCTILLDESLQCALVSSCLG